MGKKRTASMILSVLAGVAGIVFLVTFFNGYRSPFELVLGVLLFFLAVFNVIMMHKSSH